MRSGNHSHNSGTPADHRADLLAVRVLEDHLVSTSGLPPRLSRSGSACGRREPRAPIARRSRDRGRLGGRIR